MGEQSRKASYFRDAPGAREQSDPIRAAAIHMLYERAKRNILAKAKAEGANTDEMEVVMDVAPPETQIQVAMADTRNVLAFLGFQLAAEGAIA